MISFKVIVTASLLLIGGALVLNQEMNIGQFVAAEIIIILVIASVEKLILGLGSFYDTLTSLEKIGQIVDKELESQEGETPQFSKGIKIELDHATYAVSNRDSHILKDISLKVNQKSRILVKGESGSGKSTLLRLLAGIIEPTAGNVYVNDMSIQSLHINYYRSQLGLSLSDETPFEGSIRENLSFGNRNISDEKIHEVLEIVGLKTFLREQPEGLNTILYPDGKRMSFTISKKIVLARAILKQPKVLILEDALDRFNQDETNSIINYLSHKDRQWALVVVSSSDAWLNKCNEVIILEKGKIKNS
jgi:ABC-type bacteriocin/lantibiotic exporter with double-glycine peptidase domain